MAAKPTPRKYTPDQIRQMDLQAQKNIDKLNANSIARTKLKVERAAWNQKYKRGLV